MAEDTPGPAPLDLHQAAVLVGAYSAIERRLFELTGTLAAEADTVPEIAVFLDSLSGEHAWHAELWADRLPVLAGIDAQALVVVPPAARAVLDGLDRGDLVEKMAGLFRVVLPRLVASYGYHEAYASAVSEAPTRRALRLVLRDEAEALVAGEALAQGLLGTPEAVAVAGQHVIDLESGLVKAGVFLGLVPWPGRRG
jgi:hypothetical protein